MSTITDRDFAVRFAGEAGADMVRLRKTTRRLKKRDLTDVTDVDIDLNDRFNTAVHHREGDRASVLGEESSRLVKGASRLWVIDPIDGTREYVDDAIPDPLRSACVGIVLFVHGTLELAVAFNPFRNEMFVAERGKPTMRNSKVVTCMTTRMKSRTSYSYNYWKDAPFDLRGLERSLSNPTGLESIIYQACQVADGRSAFVAFPGDKIHDFAPSVLIAQQAGALVTDLRGQPLDLDHRKHGLPIAAPSAQPRALELIQGLRLPGLR